MKIRFIVFLVFVASILAGPFEEQCSEGHAWNEGWITPLIQNGDAFAEVLLSTDYSSLGYRWRRCSRATGCSDWIRDDSNMQANLSLQHWQCDLHKGESYIRFDLLKSEGHPHGSFNVSVVTQCTARSWSGAYSYCNEFTSLSLGTIRADNAKTDFIAPKGAAFHRPIVKRRPGRVYPCCIDEAHPMHFSDLPVDVENSPFTAQDWRPFEVRLTTKCFSLSSFGRYKRTDEPDPAFWFEQQFVLHGRPAFYIAPTSPGGSPAPSDRPTASPTPPPTPAPPPTPTSPAPTPTSTPDESTSGGETDEYTPTPTPDDETPYWWSWTSRRTQSTTPSPTSAHTPTPHRPYHFPTRREEGSSKQVVLDKWTFFGAILGSFVVGAGMVLVVVWLVLWQRRTNERRAQEQPVLTEKPEEQGYVPLKREM